MKNGVKLLLILTLTLTMSFGVFADTQTNADLLSELNLLSGTGSGNALEKSLTRAEASTFIVKILGEQSVVLSNPTSTSAFSDVNGNEWFVPYVAYCYDNGIVSGYPNGTFQPNKTVSEQEFLSMMLKAINITDTPWNMIHSKSYSEGLITKTSIDTDFLRGDVVDIMTNSLELEVKDTTYTIISRLVEKGVVTENLAVEKGLMIEDEIKSAISSVKVESNDQVNIVMNEEITSLNADIIDEDGIAVDVLKVTVNKKSITLEVDELKEKQYTVILNNVIDNQEIVTNGLSKDFEGIPKVVESDYFHISSVKAVSKNLVYVTFTHPITGNVAVPTNFEITLDGEKVVTSSFSDLKCDTVTGDEYTVALWLRDYTMLEGAPYKIIVDGDVQSMYNAKLNDGSDESFRFTGSGEKNDSFEIVDIDLIQQNYLRVRFNERVDASSGEDRDNCIVKDQYLDATSSVIAGTMTGSDEWEGREVTYYTIMLDNHNYEFILNDIEDSFEEQEIPEERYGFSKFPKFEEPEIEYAVAVNENYVQVFFTEALDAQSVKSATIIVDSHAPNKRVFDDKSPHRLDLYMDSADDLNSDFNITFDGLKTNYDMNLGALTYTVDGTSREVDDVSIKEARRISDTQVVLFFNYAVDSSTSTNSFELSYTDKDGDKATMTANDVAFVDNMTAVVEFEDMENNVAYKVVVDNLDDITGQFTTSEAKKNIE